MNILDHCTPDQMLNSLFYFNGLHFAIREGEELANLKITQFRIEMRENKKRICFIMKGIPKSTKEVSITIDCHQMKKIISLAIIVNYGAIELVFLSESNQMTSNIR